MNVHSISALPNQPQAAPSADFSFAADTDAAGKLQLGQIIKARVLRHYGEGRYTVEWGGREKVVDSAVPLQTGELLHGKVVGLGERVVLERVRMPQVAEGTAAAAEGKSASRTDSASQLVADLFEKYRGQLTPEQIAIVEQSVRGAEDPQLMAMSGLLLSKLGMGPLPEWLKSIYALLRTEPNRGLFALRGQAPELQTADRAAHGTQDFASGAPITPLAELLRQCMEQTLEKPADPAQGFSEARLDPRQDVETGGKQDSGADHGHDLPRLLMNVQSGGSVGHRINTIPLLVNGRLLELNIAVFEQREGRQTKEETRHRQLSFSLHSEQLGQVEVRTVLTGERMKLAFSSDRESTVEWLSTYSPELMAQLGDEGWRVDELHYAVRPQGGVGVAHAVLQRLVSQDSVSRLV